MIIRTDNSVQKEFMIIEEVAEYLITTSLYKSNNRKMTCYLYLRYYTITHTVHLYHPYPHPEVNSVSGPET